MPRPNLLWTNSAWITYLVLAHACAIAASLSVGDSRQDSVQKNGRRQFLSTIAAMTTAPLFPHAKAATAKDIQVPPLQDELVYVGCGCFWHLQHSIALFEREELGRTGSALSCQAGYAGGQSSSRICYHNKEHIVDYAELGHTEVVQVALPTSKVVEFMDQLYFRQAFDPNTKDRRDPMDKGPEYRNAIGLIGGGHHPLYSNISKVAKQNGYRLIAGKGQGDPDTLGSRLVYVYDTNIFPFAQAEIYHQFHNDFHPSPMVPSTTIWPIALWKMDVFTGWTALIASPNLCPHLRYVIIN